MTFTVGLNYDYINARDRMIEQKMHEVKTLRQPHRFDAQTNAISVLQGFTVEAAWAQYNNAPYVFRPYEPLGDDVLGYQLRSTKHDDGHLITYERDANAIYILGICNDICTTVKFVGWSTKKRANIPSHRQTHLNGYKLHEAAYCTSQQELWSFDLMPATGYLVEHRKQLVGA